MIINKHVDHWYPDFKSVRLKATETTQNFGAYIFKSPQLKNTLDQDQVVLFDNIPKLVNYEAVTAFYCGPVQLANDRCYFGISFLLLLLFFSGGDQFASMHCKQ